MKLALIPPLAHLDTIRRGDMQLMLPQLVNEPRYATAYKMRIQSGDFTILDNGAAEGKAVKDEELLDIAGRFHVQEVAIPDVLGGMLESVDQATAFYDTHHRAMRMLHEQFGTKFGYVAQGRTVQEAINGAAAILDHIPMHILNTIYIPRLLIKETMDPYARMKVAEGIHEEYGDADLHLFGTSPLWSWEVREAAQHKYIRSIDTSMPYNYAFQTAALAIHRPMSPDAIINRPKDYFNQVLAPGYQHDLMDTNIHLFRQWANGLTA